MKKLISLLLITSMLISMSSCSLFDKDNKKVLKVAEEYANAVVEGDIDDLAVLYEDDDEFEGVVGAYIDRYSSRDDTDEIHDIIHDNMTYTIDKKTIKSSKKSGKASVVITFTLIDYDVIYEDLDEDADVDDFIDALEDNTEEAMTIRANVEFELSRDEWKVVDENFETILDVYEFYAEIASYGFGSLHPITLNDFENALGNYDSDYYDSYTYDGIEIGRYFPYGITFRYSSFDDIDEARDCFEQTYDIFEDLVDNNEFDGAYNSYYEGNYGYILFDGDSNDMEYLGDHLYGGIYLSENVVVYAIATDDSSSYRQKVDEFLAVIGYPIP